MERHYVFDSNSISTLSNNEQIQIQSNNESEHPETNETEFMTNERNHENNAAEHIQNETDNQADRDTDTQQYNTTNTSYGRRTGMMQNIARGIMGAHLSFILAEIIGAIIIATQVNGEVCEQPLMIWNIGMACRGCILAPIIMHDICWPLLNVNEDSSTVQAVRKGSSVFTLSWFILGIWWISKASTCSDTAPTLYRWCLTILSIQAVGYGWPFLLIVAYLCCAPLLIFSVRFFSRVPSNGVMQFIGGATRTEIDALNCKNYSPGMFTDSEEPPACAICLTPYERGDKLRILPCSHHFHAQWCADNWLLLHASCPLCRAPIDGRSPDRHHVEETVPSSSATDNQEHSITVAVDN